MEVLLFLMIGVGLVGWTLYRGYLRAKQIHELIDRGRPAQGTVSARRRFHNKSGGRHFIWYEYNVDGQVRKGRSHVTRTEFDNFSKGQTIALRYLPDNPKVAAPEFVVQSGIDARKQLEEKQARTGGPRAHS